MHIVHVSSSTDDALDKIGAGDEVEDDEEDEEDDEEEDDEEDGTAEAALNAAPRGRIYGNVCSCSKCTSDIPLANAGVVETGGSGCGSVGPEYVSTCAIKDTNGATSCKGFSSKCKSFNLVR